MIRKVCYLFFILTLSITCYAMGSKSSQKMKQCLWDESLSYLSNISIETSDFQGGTIITEWYSIGNVLQKVQVIIRNSKKLEDSISATVLKNINNLISKDFKDGKKITDAIILSTKKCLQASD